MTVRRLQLIILGLAGAVAAAVGRHILSRRRDHATGSTEPEGRWTCACGAEYRVTGVGRHQVFWPADGDPRDAVMSKECPQCGRALARETEPAPRP
jgi:hypothetical protein